MGYCYSIVEYWVIRPEDRTMRHDSRPRLWRGMGLTGLAVVLVWFSVVPVSRAADDERRKPVDDGRLVRPIIAANCVGCHGAERPKGGLDLRSVASMLRGGKSGPALDPSDPDGSLLLERIAARRDAAGQGAETVGPRRSRWCGAGSAARSPCRSPRGRSAAGFSRPRRRSAVLVVSAAPEAGDPAASPTSPGCGHRSTPSCSRGWSRRA